MESGRGSLAGLLGRCPAMVRLRREIEEVGPSELRVHVFGETGTGKELVARALHEASPRARGPLVPVNAGAFSDELFANELFGHARGAFTGAVVAREGYVAEAEGGTLFIDEVGEMTPLAQVRLLRFLESGEYQRLGETGARRADVRVISATNVDLERRVREGRFREDLWFRLAGELLYLPPLRERGGDVTLLARHFLRAQAAGRGVAAPLPAARGGGGAARLRVAGQRAGASERDAAAPRAGPRSRGHDRGPQAGPATAALASRGKPAQRHEAA